MPEQMVIEGWRGVLVEMGLGRPSARALTATLLSGVAGYIFMYPRSTFREDGTLDKAFFLMPAAVGTAVFLFT